MPNIQYTAQLDFTDNGTFETGWRIKQGDYGDCEIVFRVVNNGVNMYDADISPDIAFRRSNGTSVVSTMIPNDGTYKYTFVGNELAVPGPTLVDVKYTDAQGRISTASCRFQVVEDTIGYDPTGASTYNNPVSELVAQATEDSLIAEGFAVGQQRGQDVPESSPYYHNNAKYYSELSDPTAFANMSDVDFNNLQNGQVPVYNSTSQKWENGAGGGGASSLGDLSDVSLENLQNFNQLLYDSETESWFNGFTMTYLNNLVDVSISSPSAGQVLKYSSSPLGSWSNSSLSKSDVGLGNVDNTSDLSKPISTATQTALNAKADALPTVVNDRYLHTNASTGALEWAQVQGGGSSATLLTGTLTAGNTTITFTNNAITSTALIDIYTDDPDVGWESRSVSSTTLTITFPVQASDLSVKVRIEESGV